MEKQFIFQPMGHRIEADSERDILRIARDAGVGMVGTCGGKGRCGKCLVQPVGKSTSASEQEMDLLQDAAAHGLRLACQTRMPSGGTVWIPEGSRLRDQVILTTGQEIRVQLEPVVQVYRVEVPSPSLDWPQAGAERLWSALLHDDRSLAEIEPRFPLSVLQSLSQALADGSGRVTAVVRMDGAVVAVWPGWDNRCLGLAVDLGTTTVVAYLMDLETGHPLAVKAQVNPQVPMGDDVISRISHWNGSSEESRRMRRLAIQAVNDLARSACEEANQKQGHIVDCVMVGNTAMHHIFLALNPTGLAQAPYAPIISRSFAIRAEELGLEFGPEAWVHWLPVKAGFVGADMVAVALAVDADRIADPTLILDLGTNGEMILAHKGRLMSCSTAAGPAFEGGHVGHGMRGAPGAVEKVSLGSDDCKPRLEVIGGTAPAGLCGSGLVSVIANLLEVGLLKSTGAYNEEKQTRRLRQGPDGTEFVLALKDETGTGRDLILSARDISEVQLAKAAVRAGAEVLMGEMGIDRIERIILAGAFGNYLDPDEAASLGLFPPISPGAVTGVGNAAGAGAIMSLMSRTSRARAEELARLMEYVELSVHPDFHDRFVDALPFPCGTEE